jgi:hypothetical protein
MVVESLAEGAELGKARATTMTGAGTGRAIE